MNPTITKIKNGTITLPQSVGKQWSDKDVEIFADSERLIIRNTEAGALSLKEMMDGFQDAAQKTGLKEADALSVVRDVRRQMYGKS